MVAKIGRKLRWSRDGTPIAGATSDGLTFSAEAIEITDKDDDGWRTLLDDVGVRSFSGSVECVMKDDTFADVSTGSGSALMETCSMEIDEEFTIEGDFFLSNVQITAQQADAVRFTAELQGSGTFVATVAPYMITPAAISGTATVGQTLTRTSGTWGGDATITYDRPWQRSPDGVAWTNVGSGGTTYVLQVADAGNYIRVLETATNSVGSNSAASNILGPVSA